MRGQFITPGAWRLLNVALFVCVLACHPIRNKLYVPLFFGFAGVVLAIIDAAEGEAWASPAMLACCFVYIAALCIQNAVISSKKRREETRTGKKRRKSEK